jgi:molybdopterin molybdotransferase
LDLPPLDNSAMDGYAVRRADIAGAGPESPRELRVIGQVAAGAMPDREVTPGTAVRIMTGAPIPDGADTVVPFEETDEVQRRAAGRDLDRIGVLADVGQGSSVRPAGEDLRCGDAVVKTGTVLRPSEVGVLASVGRERVRVVRRPVVAILATGDELAAPGQSLGPGMIHDANSLGVAAEVIRSGGVPKLLGIARDNLADMNRKLEEGLDADLLITSAGVSRGDYDMVKDVLSQRGEVAFWSVRMRPAKPLAFGALRAPDGRRVPHIGLPGNPVSAMVAFEQFCRPAVLKMLGRTRLARPTVRAVLKDPIHNTDGRRVYARAIITREGGRYVAALTGPQGSNILTSMARANGLAICPEDLAEAPAGQEVEVQMVGWSEEAAV